MRPFEFFILFLSFIYTLSLGHLLFAATRMIRHRRSLKLSWPHAFWMATVLIVLFANWIALWDFHGMQEIALPVIVSGFLISVLQYFICALVSPDFEDGEGYDMHVFHERERKTYLGATLALLFVAVATNLSAGRLGVQHWAEQNAVVLAMFVPVALGIFVRTSWVQVVSAAVTMVLCAVSLSCLLSDASLISAECLRQLTTDCVEKPRNRAFRETDRNAVSDGILTAMPAR